MRCVCLKSCQGPKLGSANVPELRGAAWPLMLGQMGTSAKQRNSETAKWHWIFVGFRGRDTRSLHGSLMFFAGFDPYASDKEVQRYQEMRPMRSSRFFLLFRRVQDWIF